ncbi:hypothetical protein [Pandoraea cepalis]|uniref:hypothetical protein n=1 Tax=Pandoraea cepalis TaxID=2508294 RepID=UPI00263A696C|nr:hypothetical protein [Pandoraea cepalis]
MNNFGVTLSAAPRHDDLHGDVAQAQEHERWRACQRRGVAPPPAGHLKFISDCVLYNDHSEITVTLAGSRPSRPTPGLYKVLQDRATQIPQLASNLNQSALATDAMKTNTAQYRIGLRIDSQWIVYQACAVSDCCF